MKTQSKRGTPLRQERTARIRSQNIPLMPDPVDAGLVAGRVECRYSGGIDMYIACVFWTVLERNIGECAMVFRIVFHIEKPPD